MPSDPAQRPRKVNSVTPSMTYQDHIAVLNLGDDENRFSPDWLDTVDELLDTAERDAQALVSTAAGKFYSNGLDVDWMIANPKQAQGYIKRVETLLSRILTFPMPTVAAINGHAFGGAAMLAVAHDYRVMRADRGYCCFPEVDLRLRFTAGIAALIQAKLTPSAALAAMTTGQRFDGPAAQAIGLVDLTADEPAVVTSAMDVVTPLCGKDRATLAAIKAVMFTSVTDALNSSISV